MPTASISKSTLSADLKTCVRRIRTQYLILRRGSHQGLVQAWEIGKDLLALRKKVGHGKWEKFVRTDLTFIGPTTAKAYMRIAKAFKTKEELAGLTLEEGKALAAKKLAKGPRQPDDELKWTMTRLTTCTRRLREWVNELGRLAVAGSPDDRLAECRLEVEGILKDLSALAPDGAGKAFKIVVG